MKPTAFYSYNQGKQNLTVGKGICYGYCKTLGKEVRDGITVDDACNKIYKAIASNNTRTMQSSTSKQKTSDQSGESISIDKLDDIPVVLCCNISSGFGTCTHFSLPSYVCLNRWWADHACLIYKSGDQLMIFDPNTGLSRWTIPTTLTYALLNEMLEYGYKRQKNARPVYSTSLQRVRRSPQPYNK